MRTTRAFRGRTKAPRTRSGCLTCRERKVKCDEQRPQCRRCLDGRRTCQYGVKVSWLEPDKMSSSTGEDPFSRPRGQLLPRKDAARQVPFLNTTYDDFRIHAGEPAQDSPLSADSTATGERRRFSPSPFQVSISVDCPDPTLSYIDRFIFDYYAHKMCTNCALLDSNSNSYRRVIIPISFHSQLVLQSCLAAAANQMRHHNSSYSQAALRHRGSCLKSLHRQIAFLNSGQVSTMVATKTEILGAILMLLFFEYSSTSFRESLRRRTLAGWKVHLDGARKILELTSTLGSPQCDQAISSFLGHYLAAQSVLSYVTMADASEGEALVRGGRYWLSRSVRPVWEINSLAGCSNELLGIIMDLVEGIRRGEASSEGDREMASEWRSRLSRLVQQPPTTYTINGAPGEASGRNSDVLQYEEPGAMSHAIAVAFREVALLFLQYLERGTDTGHGVRVGERASTIMASFPRVCNHPKIVQGHSVFLWPYFIAACHLTGDADRAAAMMAFQALAETSRNIRAVALPMLETVENVWKQLDMQNGGLGVYHVRDGFIWERVLRGRGWVLNWS